MSLLNDLIEEHKQLLPDFLKKDETSNIHKHLTVLNHARQGLIEQTHIVNLGLNINRPITIEKVQNRFYNCKLYFKVNMVDLKKITITNETEEPTIIIDKTYNEKGNNYFEYEITVESEINPIPTDKFLITVETFNGLILHKGYPENDIKKDDYYDHDYNIDKIGALYNIKRYTHIPVDLSDYERTLPPYHNKATEDDYHYMTRILTYINEFANVPLPILELWKHYGVYSEMKNRKVILHRQNVHYMQPTPTPLKPNLPIFMKTKMWYNPCVYDIYVNYDDFPSNLNLPKESDIADIFTANLPITHLSQYNVNVKIANGKDFEINNCFDYKLGESTIINGNPFSERDYLTIPLTDLNLDTETGDLVQTNTEEDKNYLVYIDSKFNLWIMESEYSDDAELYLDTVNGELQAIKEDD